MRVIIQRVKSAGVTVNESIVSRIDRGLLLLVGIGRDDSTEDIEYIVRKVVNLRIFEDAQGKMNLNIQQVNGQVLSVSQFTLYADTTKGNRPGFDQSAKPDTAEEYWNKFNSLLKKSGVDTKEGIFAAHMEVELVNDGPVTIMLDSKNR